MSRQLHSVILSMPRTRKPTRVRRQSVMMMKQLGISSRLMGR